MHSILYDIWHQIVSLKPSFISKSPHFNFITVHYFYIIGIALFGSICLYPHGNIKYIDALFMGTGVATQSGLNTVDLNKLNTFQQFVLYFIPMLANPITIHTFVVFLRLYWFEKRFQHIAKEAKKNRRSISKTMSKAKTNERDIGQEEMGVRGRSIVVMHNTTVPNGMTNDRAVPEDLKYHLEKGKQLHQGEEVPSSSTSEGASKGQSSESEDDRASVGTVQRSQTQIKFADQVKPSNGQTDDPLRIPTRRNHEDHIAFLERQRNPDNSAVLRIPGPRDADAGMAPETVDHGDNMHYTLSGKASTFSPRRDSIDTAVDGDEQVPETRKTRPRNLTFTEPTRPPPGERIANDVEAAKHTLNVFKFRKPKFLSSKSEKAQEGHPAHFSLARSATLQGIRSALSRDKDDTMPYLSWEPTVGRNSAFVDLTESQREELGGIEYRSLKSLALVLTLYFWGFTLLGILGLVPWILRSPSFGAVVTDIGQGRVWWGFYTANSAFTDLGFTLTPDSMNSFQQAIWPLVLLSFLIIAGNTGFPVILRFIIWVTSLYVPKESGIWEELRFLLDHPRRCFTLLFPSKATWWLFWILVMLNGVDLIFFIILDLGNTIVTQLPVNIRVLDGWFQAVATRTAGFAVVNISQLHPAIQVSYLIMMYISVLPIAISVRRTNVYEEKSLGIYGSASQETEDEGEPSYVGAHLRRQLSFDLWYIFLGLFILAISEGKRLQGDDPDFTLFTVLFEIVSAYGTVGLSLGYPTINASFSAEFGVIGKLVIISMQIRGRHRGLPYELDRAILLPSENLQLNEGREDAASLRRQSSMATNGPGGSGSESRNRSRSKSTDRHPPNFLNRLLHPGPMIPSSHRDVPLPPKGSTTRRHSISTPGMPDRSRSASPTATSSGAHRTQTQISTPVGETRDWAGDREGRRRFFKEGANPEPPANGSS
ncbi:putative potassium transport protein 1 [Venustampulla echinocandica]|uniref:Potassium transport protein n=1 Tax=Venustampulla echinocandica TaxID=2656787 RepID=A0A370TZI6_9HELO|nr:putative potassium transport protein 1 [Venustampulla echinocandica]RDL40939.1 putative potassium transport protein 1 [Venustampulla echinocandica]